MIAIVYKIVDKIIGTIVSSVWVMCITVGLIDIIVGIIGIIK